MSTPELIFYVNSPEHTRASLALFALHYDEIPKRVRAAIRKSLARACERHHVDPAPLRRRSRGSAVRQHRA